MENGDEPVYCLYCGEYLNITVKEFLLKRAHYFSGGRHGEYPAQECAKCEAMFDAYEG